MGMSELDPPRTVRHDWLTDDDLQLPCFAMNYHRMVRDIGHAYDRWKDFCDLQLLKTLHGADDPGFVSVIEWHANRSGR